MLLPLLSILLRYFVEKLDILSLLLSIFPGNTFFMFFCLFVLRSQVWNWVGTPMPEHTSKWVSWLLNILQFKVCLFKRLWTTQHSLSVMNYFIPLEGQTWLTLHANVLSLSLRSALLFSTPRNALMTKLSTTSHSRLLNTSFSPPTPPPLEETPGIVCADLETIRFHCR